MHDPIAERQEYYQVLTRNIRIRILRISIIPMLLTSDILYWRFHLAYSDKISAHLCEPVPGHYLLDPVARKCPPDSQTVNKRYS